MTTNARLIKDVNLKIVELAQSQTRASVRHFVLVQRISALGNRDVRQFLASKLPNVGAIGRVLL